RHARSTSVRQSWAERGSSVAQKLLLVKDTSLATQNSAGSRNSDQVLSGNSGHPDLSRSGSRLVAPSDEGKDDRLAQAPRNPGSAAGGTQPAGGSKAGRSRRPKRSARRG